MHIPLLARLRARRHAQSSWRVVPVFLALGLLWLLAEAACRF